MKDIFLQTIITGCAWCKSVMSYSNQEMEYSENQKLVMLSHGICDDCFDFEAKDEVESKETIEL